MFINDHHNESAVSRLVHVCGLLGYIHTSKMPSCTALTTWRIPLAPATTP